MSRQKREVSGRLAPILTSAPDRSLVFQGVKRIPSTRLESTRRFRRSTTHSTFPNRHQIACIKHSMKSPAFTASTEPNRLVFSLGPARGLVVKIAMTLRNRQLAKSLTRIILPTQGRRRRSARTHRRHPRLALPRRRKASNRRQRAQRGRSRQGAQGIFTIIHQVLLEQAFNAPFLIILHRLIGALPAPRRPNGERQSTSGGPAPWPNSWRRSRIWIATSRGSGLWPGTRRGPGQQSKRAARRVDYKSGCANASEDLGPPASDEVPDHEHLKNGLIGEFTC